MSDRVYPINASVALPSAVVESSSDPARVVTYHESLVPLLDRQLGACRRSGSHLAVLSINVDNIETVRRRHGTAMKDKILQSVWNRLKRRLRASDIAFHANEGDFAAILLDASGMAATVVDARLSAVLCEPYCINEMEIALSVHTGFAVFPQAGETGEELVSAAVQARTRSTPSTADGRRT